MQTLKRLADRVRGVIFGVFRSIHTDGGLFIGRGVVISRGTVEVGRGVHIADRCSLTGDIMLADRVFLHRDVILRSFDGRITMGGGTTVNPFTVIYGKGGVKIGSLVSIAPGVVIAASNKIFDDLDVPMKSQGETAIGVVIEDDVWVGANAVILDGVTLGVGCVVGAGAVVTHSVPAFSVVAGTPARVIGSRDGCSAQAGLGVVDG